MRLVVLGGSSPFTAGLLAALRARVAPDVVELVLCGRDADALSIVAAHARCVGNLGAEPRWTTDPDAALDGAEVVLHQVRYGGLAARAHDDLLCAEFGIAYDETLGPGGLLAGIRARRPVIELAERLERRCPAAHVANLTNPLSLVTAMLNEEGVTDAVGLCELPVTTIARACALVDVPPASVSPSYVGLNHRGFVVGLDAPDGDVLPEVLSRVSTSSFEGSSGATVRALGALPLKYHALATGEAEAPTPGRARFVSETRDLILRELRNDPAESPRSLGQRDLSWYSDAVVPYLEGVEGRATRVAATRCRDASTADERLVTFVDGCPVDDVVRTTIPDAVAQWVERFTSHELAVSAAIGRPNRATIRQALIVDPLVDPHRVDDLVPRMIDAVNTAA